MGTAIVIIVLLVAIGVVAFLATRKKPSELSGETAHPLPPPKATEPRVETKPASVETKPAVVTQPVEPSVVAAQRSSAATAVAEPASVAAVETPAAPIAPPPVAVVETKPKAKRDITALKKGLSQTRGGWVQRLVGIFGGKKEIDPDLMEQIQETLITGDVGPRTTEHVSAILKERLSKADVSDENVVWDARRDVTHEIIAVPAAPFGSKAAAGQPLVILVVGVNGVGKTTTIGKLASKYKEQGKKVMLAAGDTFRAAAVAQLEAWGKRVGVPVVKGKDLSKPSAVVFDAVAAGIKEGAEVVIADTAGRLHTKTPLMDELRKLKDAATKALPGAPHEILLVLDATTGQNGIIQVKEFRDALELTGIVLTKLDGTAKGGVILAICDEFKLPVRFVGVGEKVDDLREFDADDFTDALFAHGEDVESATA